MPGTLAPVPRWQILDANGKPASGARIRSWLAGTTTPAPLYTDALLAVPHAWPAIADGAGRITIYLAPTSYKLQISDADDVPLYVQDDVEAVPSMRQNVDLSGVAGETLAERDVVYLSDGTGGLTSGRWYTADADTDYRSSLANLVGVVVSPVLNAGETGTIRLQGTIEGLSGLTTGVTYYVSATAGALTDTAPPNTRVVGIATTATSLLLTPEAASSSSLGVFTQLQVTAAGADALVVGGGVQAGTGHVQVIGADGRIPALDATRVADLSGANLTGLNASALGTGTVPDGRFPATLPAASGANLTGLNASQLGSGTVPSARFPATLPALSGANLTALNASNLASGAVPSARLTAVNAGNLNAGTVPSARMAGAYAGITGVGTLASAAVTGAVTSAKVGDPAFALNTDGTRGLYFDTGGVAGIAGGGGGVKVSVGNVGVSLEGSLHMPNMITAALAASQHNWNPTGLAGTYWILVSASTDLNITGIAAQPVGTVIEFVYVGLDTNVISLQHESASSSASNRIFCHRNVAFTLAAQGNGVGRSCRLVYLTVGANSRWFCLNPTT